MKSGRLGNPRPRFKRWQYGGLNPFEIRASGKRRLPVINRPPSGRLNPFEIRASGKRPVSVHYNRDLSLNPFEIRASGKRISWYCSYKAFPRLNPFEIRASGKPYAWHMIVREVQVLIPLKSGRLGNATKTSGKAKAVVLIPLKSGRLGNQVGAGVTHNAQGLNPFEIRASGKHSP